MRPVPSPPLRAALLALMVSPTLSGCLDWSRQVKADAVESDGSSPAAPRDAAAYTPDAGAGQAAPADAADDAHADAASDDPPIADAATDAAPTGPGAACIEPLCTPEAPCTPATTAHTCYGRYADYRLPVRTSGTLPAEQGFDVRADEVLDLRTGLAWQRRCDLSPKTLAEAQADCEALAGGFHLANLHELSTMWGSARAIDIDDGVFRGCEAEVYHTSALDPSAADLHYVLKFDMTLGSWDENAKASGLCVRVEQLTTDPPADRFVGYAEGNALVFDATTHLLWEAFVPSERHAVSYEAAATYCAGLDTDGRSFRLPTAAELTSFIDYGAPSDARLPPAFSGRVGYDFWSSTRLVADASSVVQVSDSGAIRSVPAAGTLLAVRCVADD